MSDTAGVFLTNDINGEAFVLNDPAQLQNRHMILSDPETGKPLHIVDREAFMASGDHTITTDRPSPGKQRRRFRKGK